MPKRLKSTKMTFPAVRGKCVKNITFSNLTDHDRLFTIHFEDGTRLSINTFAGVHVEASYFDQDGDAIIEKQDYIGLGYDMVDPKDRID